MGTSQDALEYNHTLVWEPILTLTMTFASINS